MELSRRARKVDRYHMLLFLLPVLSILYYGWWEAETLNQRADNSQRMSPMSARGRILDRHGSPLAHSHEGTRVYPIGVAAGPLVGYQLRGRNRSGMEALLRDRLSPPPPPKSLWGAIERDKESERGTARLVGPDVSLCLDAQLQQRLYAAFQPMVGVLAVARLDSGEVVAAVSTPSFDPNEIARDFNKLTGDPRSPLIERVGSGLYPVKNSEGKNLLQQEEMAGHPWFVDSPFPGFPAASAAAQIEDSLLVTPLMLMQVFAAQAPLPKTWWPNLFQEPSPETPGVAFQVQLGPGQDDENLHYWVLSGPSFGKSPEFEVLGGLAEAGEGSYVWVIVVESKDKRTLETLRGKVFPLLKAL